MSFSPFYSTALDPACDTVRLYVHCRGIATSCTIVDTTAALTEVLELGHYHNPVVVEHWLACIMFIVPTAALSKCSITLLKSVSVALTLCTGKGLMSHDFNG